MKKVHVKSYAKVNLHLRVVGKWENFHLLDSVVASIDLFDAISLAARKDDKILFRCNDPEIEMLGEDKNTAVRAARAFMQKFGTKGVEIHIKKGIPAGAGLGGSSADVAGVLYGMKKLYKIRDDVRPIAAALTSDGVYQLRGGFARLSGKGDDVRFFESKAYCYALMITPETPCSTAEVFAAFDRGGYPCGAAQSADEAWIALQSGDFMRLAASMHNDLYLPAAACNPQVAEAYEALRSMSPSGVVMSGAGSAVFALFESKELVWWAASRLKRKYDCRVVKIFGNPHM